MEWHIQHFPKELIVKLKDGYLREVVNSIGGQRKTARLLGVVFPYLHQVVKGKKNISLKRLLEIIELSPKKEKFIEKLEENIVGIKAPSSRAYWINMKLPLKLTPELARIIGHLLGDGNLRKTRGRNIRYGNKDHKLVYEFINDMKTVFGNSIYTIWVGKRGETENFMEVSCPSIIGRIINNLFGDFGTYEGKIPKIIICNMRAIKKNFLRAIFDDECTVNEDSIVIALTNRKLIYQLGKLLKDLNIKCRYGIRKDKRPNRKLQYTLSIYGRKNLIKFVNEIGLSHNLKALEIERWKKK